MRIMYLSNKEFSLVKETMNSIMDGNMIHITDEYGFTLTIKNETYVVINSESDLSEDEKVIVFYHEMAHGEGIDNEEEADKWSLQYLTENQSNLLKENWPYRHGHNFA